MDKDTLRRQVTEEIQAQFEAKLKQAKRDKQQAEEDLEAASERWRSEKRRMNSEIDRLEGAVAEAKGAAGRKRPAAADGKAQPVDGAAIAKAQEAAEEKLKKASDEWDTERGKLKSQISRLEGAVADAIARAANPMRSTQSVKEQFEIELNKTLKEKTDIEQAYLRSKTEWEQEKLKMTGDMVKLRRSAQMMGKPVPKDDTPDVNPKVRDLENQLKESLSKWNTEREKLSSQIQKLEQSARQWDTERRQLNDHAGQLQQAFVQAQAQIQNYEAAARAPKPADEKVGQLEREKEKTQRQFQDERGKWETERADLNSQIERLDQQLQRMSEKRDSVSNEIVDQLRKQYEQKLQDAIQQKTQLAADLQKASSMLESERARLTAEIAGSKSSANTRTEGAGVDHAKITAEVARIEASINEIIAVIDNPATDLSTVIRKNVEKAELDAYLKGILFSLGQNRGM